MPARNVTIALPEDLLARSRRYAEGHGTTLNNLIRTQLEKLTSVHPGSRTDRLFAIADAAKGRSAKPWRREDLYDR
jgi:hypothetical protein